MYVQQLIDGQAETEVDAISGVTSSGQNFEKLVAAVLKQAMPRQWRWREKTALINRAALILNDEYF